MSLEVFSPSGQTQYIGATANTASTATSVPAGANVVRFYNGGTAVAFVAINATAVIPVSGTPAYGIPIGIGQTEQFSVPALGTYTAISSATLIAYATPGVGA